MVRVGPKVRHFRVKNSMTQKDLAEKAGVKQSYITKIEADATIPSLNVLHDIARALGVKTKSLIDEIA